jgi:hypothetical protein
MVDGDIGIALDAAAAASSFSDVSTFGFESFAADGELGQTADSLASMLLPVTGRRITNNELSPWTSQSLFCIGQPKLTKPNLTYVT